MTLEGLIDRIGPLAETFSQFEFDLATIQQSDEITKDRGYNNNLRDKWFYTANFGMYTVEDDGEFLYFGGREANPIFANIEKATTQLIKNQNYEPGRKGIKAVIDSVQTGKTLKIKLSDLELKGDNGEWRYFEIDTSNCDKTLNATQRAFAERVYGQGNDFGDNMIMFEEAGINTTKIYVLNPEYVKTNVKKGSAIVRASKLGRFVYNSVFFANVRSVDDNDALRGVSKVAEDDVRKAYETILSSPNVVLKYMDERGALTFSNIATKFQDQQRK